MDVLTTWEQVADFLCNDIAQMINEICGISRGQIFNINQSLLQL